MPEVTMGSPGRGKRGGVRVIYFLRLDPEQIVLVTMYAKNVREDIDPKLLRRLKELFENG
jgi:mRNA-degrading endonuclease RelE of RelBE toxin-antitoxin system